MPDVADEVQGTIPGLHDFVQSLNPPPPEQQPEGQPVTGTIPPLSEVEDAWVPPAFRGEMANARRTIEQRGESTLETWTRRFNVAGVHTIMGEAPAERARERIRKGVPEGPDFLTVASHDLGTRSDESRSASEKIGGAALKLPVMYGEYVAAKGVTQLAGMALGFAPQAARSAPTMLGRAGEAIRDWRFWRDNAIQTAAMPSMYVPEMPNINRQAERDPMDIRGLPSAFAYGMLNTAILGTFAEGANNIAGDTLRAFTHRLAVRTGWGMAEQQAVDAIAQGISDTVLPLGYKVDTGYGLIGDAIQAARGKKSIEDVFVHAASQAMTFAGFALAHGHEPGTMLARYGQAFEAQKEAGVSKQAASTVISRFQEQIARMDPAAVADYAATLPSKTPTQKALKGYATAIGEGFRPTEGPDRAGREMPGEPQRLLEGQRPQESAPPGLPEPKTGELPAEAPKAPESIPGVDPGINVIPEPRYQGDTGSKPEPLQGVTPNEPSRPGGDTTVAGASPEAPRGKGIEVGDVRQPALSAVARLKARIGERDIKAQPQTLPARERAQEAVGKGLETVVQKLSEPFKGTKEELGALLERHLLGDRLDFNVRGEINKAAGWNVDQSKLIWDRVGSEEVPGRTLEDIAKDKGVSREAVRQQEKKALKKAGPLAQSIEKGIRKAEAHARKVQDIKNGEEINATDLHNDPMLVRKIGAEERHERLAETVIEGINQRVLEEIKNGTFTQRRLEVLGRLAKAIETAPHKSQSIGQRLGILKRKVPEAGPGPETAGVPLQTNPEAKAPDQTPPSGERAGAGVQANPVTGQGGTKKGDQARRVREENIQVVLETHGLKREQYDGLKSHEKAWLANPKITDFVKTEIVMKAKGEQTIFSQVGKLYVQKGFESDLDSRTVSLLPKSLFTNEKGKGDLIDVWANRVKKQFPDAFTGKENTIDRALELLADHRTYEGVNDHELKADQIQKQMEVAYAQFAQEHPEIPEAEVRRIVDQTISDGQRAGIAESKAGLSAADIAFLEGRQPESAPNEVRSEGSQRTVPEGESEVGRGATRPESGRTEPSREIGDEPPEPGGNEPRSGTGGRVGPQPESDVPFRAEAAPQGWDKVEQAPGPERLTSTKMDVPPGTAPQISRILEHASQSMKGLAKADQVHFLGTLTKTLGGMTQKARDVLENTKPQYHWYDTTEKLTAEVNKITRRYGGQERKERAGGVVQFIGNEIHVHLDGGAETTGKGWLTRQVYSHELWHVLDGSYERWSDKPEWREAIKAETVSNYAKTKPSEAWAEFGRVLDTAISEGPDAIAALKEKYPLSYAVAEEAGFAPKVESKKGEVTQKDVFGQRVQLDNKGGHADMLKPDAVRPAGVVFHAGSVGKEFSKTTDLGFHFGTEAQAQDRAGEGRPVRKYSLNIRNALEMKDTFGNDAAGALDTAAEVKAKGLDTPAMRKAFAALKEISDRFDKAAMEVMKLDPKDSVGKHQSVMGAKERLQEQMKKLQADLYARTREAIEAAGYDGIRYLNHGEGGGKPVEESWVAFKNEQVRTEAIPETPKEEEKPIPGAGLVTGEKTPSSEPPKTVGQRLKDWFKEYVTNKLDVTLKLMDSAKKKGYSAGTGKDAYTVYSRTQNSEPTVAEDYRTNGIWTLHDGKQTRIGMPFEKQVSGLKADDMKPISSKEGWWNKLKEQFDQPDKVSRAGVFMVARHAIEEANAGRGFVPEEQLNQFKAAMEEFKRDPEFVSRATQAHDNLTEHTFNASLRARAATDIHNISPEEADYYINQRPTYIPTTRAKEDADWKAASKGKHREHMGGAIHARGESSEKIIDPLISAQDRLHSTASIMMEQVRRNSMAQYLLHEGMNEWAEKAVKEEMLGDEGYFNPKPWSDTTKPMWYWKGPNGDMQAFRIKNRQLYDLITNQQGNGNAVVEMLRWAGKIGFETPGGRVNILPSMTKAVKTGATGASMGFQVRNALTPFRDPYEFLKNTIDRASIKDLPSFLARAYKAELDIARGNIPADNLFRAFKSVHGENMRMFSWEPGDTKDVASLNSTASLLKTLMEKTKAGLQVAGAGELGPRMLEFRNRLKELGWTEARLNEEAAKADKAAAEGKDYQDPIPYFLKLEAAKAAAEVTVDFSRGGVLTGELNKIVPFFQPAIAGVNKAIRNIKSNPKGAAIALAGFLGAKLAHFLMFKDEDWYKQISAHDRFNNFVIPIGGKLYRLPGARDFEVPIGGTFTTSLEVLAKQKPDVMGLLQQTYGALAPPVPLPPLANVPWQIQGNKDWMGRDIVPKKDEGLPASHNFFEHQLPYAAGQLTGGRGELSMRGLGLNPFGEVKDLNRSVNEFYNQLHDLEGQRKLATRKGARFTDEGQYRRLKQVESSLQRLMKALKTASPEGKVSIRQAMQRLAGAVR